MTHPDNPMGTRGFAFLEFAAPDPDTLRQTFGQLGFARDGASPGVAAEAWGAGEAVFFVASAFGYPARFAQAHGPSVSGVGLRVADAAAAHARALSLGAMPAPADAGLPFPAIEGIGGALLYLVDDTLLPLRADPASAIVRIDHITHNVRRGAMDTWCGYYERLFGFSEAHYFDVEGQATGMRSRAMRSPCGRIKIPVNEASGDHDAVDQIEEYLRAYKGEGVQHIALLTRDIYGEVDAMRARGLPFMTPPPDTYYEAVAERLPGHHEPIDALQDRAILIDGQPGKGLLLQIFTETRLGPIFFEVIERKGDEGFGEGNFRALFESLERDQMRRGVLSSPIL